MRSDASVFTPSAPASWTNSPVRSGPYWRNPGRLLCEGRLAGLDKSTLRVDDLHAHYDIGGTTVTRRAHE